jgi:hypothetical protein
MYKKYLTSMLLIVVPIVIGFFASFIIKLQFIHILSAIYLVMLIAMIPSDSFLGNHADYQAKSLNPGHQEEKNKFSIQTKKELLDFFLVLIAAVLSLYISYLLS